MSAPHRPDWEQSRQIATAILRCRASRRRALAMTLGTILAGGALGFTAISPEASPLTFVLFWGLLFLACLFLLGLCVYDILSTIREIRSEQIRLRREINVSPPRVSSSDSSSPS